jgi:hypothetical protein
LIKECNMRLILAPITPTLVPTPTPHPVTWYDAVCWQNDTVIYQGIVWIDEQGEMRDYNTSLRIEQLPGECLLIEIPGPEATQLERN